MNRMGSGDQDEFDQTVVRLTRMGLSASQIASRLGCSTRTVQRVRARADAMVRPPAVPLTEFELREAQRLLEDGCSYAEVGRTLGRSRVALQRAIPGYAWTPDQISQQSRLARIERGIA